MKASIAAILFACLLSVCVSTTKDAENTPWDGMNCEELRNMESEDLTPQQVTEMAEVCEINKGYVYNRRKHGDLSVVYSTYIRETRDSFKDQFTMHELKFGGVSPDLSGVPETSNSILNILADGEIAALDTPLETHYRIYAKKSDYVVYAAVDLMNLVYTREFKKTEDGKEWKFSAEQVRQALATDEEYNNAKLVFEYLREDGVCLEEEYYVQGGPCRRYFIGNYYRLLDMTNQGLVDKLESGHPVYAQVALHPDIFQFHSPSAEYPISKGYTQPNFAGVVTGFNFEGKRKYWEMYIRRHELHPDLDHGFQKTENNTYNYVRIAAKFEDENGIPLNPYAGITSMAYTIDVDEDDRDRGMTVNKLLEVNLEDGVDSIGDEDSFQEAVMSSIRKMYKLEDSGLSEDQIQEEIDKHIDEIETLYVHPEFFDVESLKNNSTPLNITDVLPNLHTISIDLGEGGEWNEDYPYIIQDFYDFDLTFVDQSHLSRRRLNAIDGNDGNGRRLKGPGNNDKYDCNDKHGYKHGIKDPRHPCYEYDGRDYDYSQHYIDDLSDKHKNHHIKVTGKLKSLIFGRNTMPYMSLIVKHSPFLEYIYAKDYSFDNGWYIHIEDCEQLKQISFGLHTFSGWLGGIIPNGVSMYLKDLPNLNTFVFDYDAAFNVRKVTCEDVGNKGDFTLVEDRAFPNQIAYKYNHNNNAVVNEYFLKAYEEATATPAPEGPTAEPELDE